MLALSFYLNAVPERNSLHLWLIVLRLLHDEDSYVRQQVALVVRHLKSVSGNELHCAEFPRKNSLVFGCVFVKVLLFHYI